MLNKLISTDQISIKMKRFYSFITSMPFMAFLFVVLAVSMAIATFIESSSGTPAARALVYNTHWFELLWALFGLNLINNLFKYKFLTKKRFPLAIFHISFLLILLGAGITRYFSYEGMMHIRENQSSNFILSSKSCFSAELDNQKKEKEVSFTEFSPKKFSAKFDVNGRNVKIKSVGFITNATRKIVQSESGEPIIDFVFSAPGAGGMQSVVLKKDSDLDSPDFAAGFNIQKEKGINFFVSEKQLFMTSADKIEETTMTSGEITIFEAGDTIKVQTRFLYSLGRYRFLVRSFYSEAKIMAVKSENATNEDAVIIEILDGNKIDTVPVFGHSGVEPEAIFIPLKNRSLKLAFGSFPRSVPFSIYLKDFQLERYPGSKSPSSFASEVVLIDENAGIKKDIRIFMNNTLNYKGYKFFQSSYDTDERGTVLSVNHDFWGTWITYIGYFLLFLGIVLSLLNRNSHFQFLTRKLKQTAFKTILILFIITGLATSTLAQSGIGAEIPEIDKEIVDGFSRLWVQGVDGRIEPVSTLTSEIVRKISRKSSLFGKSTNEVVLSMMAHPKIWQSIPLIKVSNKTLAAKLGANNKYVAIEQLFDAQGNYSISKNVKAAHSKNPALRNRVEKEYIYVDERVNIAFMIFRGTLLNIFPRSTKEASWYTPGEIVFEYSGGDSIFVKNGFNLFLQSINEKNSIEAKQVISAISNFQTKYGANLIPSETKKYIEILYNKINPFKRIFIIYLLFGFLLLFILFVNVFRQKQLSEYLRISFSGIIFLAFFIHTAGLIVRWYISGHAPWSNGYESVVYVAWAAMLAGFIFGRKFPMVVGTSAFLAGIALFVAHLSWMNPEVTNLVPVLKSYWLTIHVAVITASYGFIGLSAFLGILVLILIILRNKSNEGKSTEIIKQLTTINEMSATIGLYFLVVGTFLGAIWANESWGRYWGWDPKETWSLVTIIVYSFIVHMRLIPSLKGVLNFNIASIIGIIAVLMTWFGVNYYLTGLHSYGKGAAYGINPAVPIIFIILGGLMVFAYIKNTRFEKNNI